MTMHDHDLYDFYVLVCLFFLRARSHGLVPTKRRPQEMSGTCAHPGSLFMPMGALRNIRSALHASQSTEAGTTYVTDIRTIHETLNG
ncbi:MAG: hypothetical protein MMC33_010232 [Icmadophila ericetorum]|nr:hypothetical protein [Icmadophila ericetorum]